MSPNLRRTGYRAYTISQLCREFSVTPRAMRFYEEQGLLRPERRNMARIYSYRDRARLQLVVRGRRVGIPLAEIRRILELYEQKGEAAQSARALKVFQDRIAALEAQRRDVEAAIQSLEAAAARLARQYPTVLVSAA